MISSQRIFALFRDIRAAFSLIVAIVTFAHAPVAHAGISASPNPNTGDYTVAWSAVPGADDYRLQESSNGGATWTNYFAWSTSKSFSGKAPGTYLYKVRWCDLVWRRGEPLDICRNTNFPAVSVTVNNAVPPVPTGLTGPGTDYNGAYTISWNASTGAASYRLEQRFGSGSWTLIHNSSARSKAISGAVEGTWSYRVRACNATGLCSNYSSTLSVTVAPPPAAPVVTAPGTDYNGAYNVSWGSVSTATTYRLEEKTGSGSWVQIYSGGGLGAARSGNNPGTYYYRARACNTESVCGGWSATRTVTVASAPLAPTSLTSPATDYDGNYTMSWNSTATATSYRLEEQIGASTAWAQVYIGSALSKTITGKSVGTYKYRVRGCNVESVCGGWSSIRTVTVANPPSIPGGLSGPGSDADGAFNINWNSSAGSTTYRLDELPPSGSWSQVHSGSATNKTLTGRNPGAYSYRVRGCNADGLCSAWSSSVSVEVTPAATAPPAPPTPATHTDPGPSSESDQTGTITGNFRVDESGAATYNIPVFAAAGTAGVAPKISLNYSSSAGNSIAGMGWSMGGLSAVTRCRQTYDQDRNPTRITWGSNDRFCLDGQRLVLYPANQPTYGATNSTYRTEVDGGAIVTIRGSLNGEPDYFEVRRQDGSFSYYGKSPDAAADESAKYGGSTGSTLIWAIRHFADNIGNPIWFEYHNDALGHRIDEIRWAFGTGRGPVSGANARLVFDYSDRDDKRTSYVGGLALPNAVKLTAIRSYNTVGAEVLVRKYNLRYNQNVSAPDKLNRLTSIEECVGSTCLPETTFSWRVPTSSNALTLLDSFSMAPSANLSGYQLADINGDGLMDVVWLEGPPATAKMNYAISNGTSLTQRAFSNNSMEYSLPGDAEKLTPIDYNLDGRYDIAYWDDNASRWRVVISHPQSDGTWRLKNAAYLTPIDHSEVTFVDIDSNGTTDAVWATGSGTGQKQLKRSLLEPNPGQSTSSSIYYRFGTPVNIGTPSAATTGNLHAVAADFDGDGRVGIMMGRDIPECEYEFNPPQCFGNGYASAINIVNPTSSTPGYASYAHLNILPSTLSHEHAKVSGTVVTDVNADGLSDLFYPVWRDPNVNINEFHLAINRGNGSFDVRQQYNTTLKSSGVQRPQFVDWNGDNHPDLVWKDTTGSGSVKIRYWDPSTNDFGPIQTITWLVSTSTNESVYFPDMNGDGVPDVVKIDVGTGVGAIKVYTRKSGQVVASRASNRIEKITNGLGGETEITYEPLSYTDHYQGLTFDTGNSGGPNCVWTTGAEPMCITPPPSEVSAAGFYDKINGDWDLPSGAQTLGKNSPVLEMSGPMYVVTDVTGSAPSAVSNAAKSAIRYDYKQAKLQAAGRGFLGFQQLVTTDMQTNVKTTTRYRQDWPFSGMPIGTVVTTPSGKTLSASSTEWEVLEWTTSSVSVANQGTTSLGPIHVLSTDSRDETYALASNGTVQGAHLTTVRTETDYDAEGNSDWIKVTTTNETTPGVEQIVETNNVFNTTTFDRWDGRLDSTAVTTTRPNLGGGVTRESSFQYYSSGVNRGMLWKEILEPNTEHELITTHSYDAYGNAVKSAVTATDDGSTRCNVTSALYDSSGRYVNRSYDCVGRLTSEVMSRNIFGSPTKVDAIVDATNTNARVSTYIYHGALGAEYFRWSDDGSSATVYLSRTQGNCPAGTSYRATTTTAGGASSQVCYDKLAREVRAMKLGFDGQWNGQDSQYDDRGNVRRVSEPFDISGSQSSAPFWTTMEYDLLGRVTRTDLPFDDGINWGTTTYTDFEKITENYKNQKRTVRTNALGEIVYVKDHLQSVTTFAYDHLGKLSTTRDHDGNVTSTVYNKVGEKISMSDPNKGNWSFKYNGFGELYEKTSARNQTSTMTYDGLGRMKTRIDRKVAGCTSSASSCVEGSTIWNYDTAPNGLGKPDNVQDMYSGYLRTIMYDSLGRVDEVVTYFDAGVYFERSTYDQYGRPYQTFDAAGDGSYTDHGVVNQYNAYGYLESIGDAVQINGAPQTIYRKVLSMNARDKVVQEQLGIDEQGNAAVTTTYNYYAATGGVKNIDSVNAAGQDVQDLYYEWDQLGNLTLRQEHSGSKNLQEEFDYDDLNRLIYANATGQTPQYVSYFPNGNIKTKTGVSGQYSYGSNAGPHAVTSVNGSTYYYDANGNNTSGGGRSMGYYTFDKPSTISKGGQTTSFEYGPDRARFRRIDNAGSTTTTTRYIGNVEIISRNDGTQERKRYIGGVAIETSYFSNGVQANRETLYTFKDHLGSMDVITDDAGQVVQELSFGAWGQRRNATNWQELIASQLIDLGPNFDASITRRGFTGHEMIDGAGLIHMNGRIYDPILGRFMQADTFVQDPTNTQSLNRYSYVLNNPLNATDPTGFFFDKLFKALNKLFGKFAPLIGIALLAIPGVGTWVAASWQNAFTFGFWTGGIGSGSFKGALMGGLSGAAFHGIGAKFNDSSGFFKQGGIGHIGAHASAGGILSELQGGKFGHGFLSAGFSKGVMSRVDFNYEDISPSAVMGRTVVAGVVGGTSSAITGGKFANGARTAAMAHLFNQESNNPFRKAYQDNVPNRPEVEYKDVLDADLKVIGVKGGHSRLGASYVTDTEGNGGLNVVGNITKGMAKGAGLSGGYDADGNLELGVGRAIGWEGRANASALATVDSAGNIGAKVSVGVLRSQATGQVEASTPNAFYNATASLANYIGAWNQAIKDWYFETTKPLNWGN